MTYNFNFLGKWVWSNGLDKEPNKGRAGKLEPARSRLARNRYNKRAISYKATLVTPTKEQ